MAIFAVVYHCCCLFGPKVFQLWLPLRYLNFGKLPSDTYLSGDAECNRNCVTRMHKHPKFGKRKTGKQASIGEMICFHVRRLHGCSKKYAMSICKAVLHEKQRNANAHLSASAGAGVETFGKPSRSFFFAGSSGFLNSGMMSSSSRMVILD